MPLNYERPDGFLGALMAFEGITDGFTIIHGPTGCKYYPASVAESAYQYRPGQAAPAARNVLTFTSRYFFTQPRIPCTYLDSGKFVTGGRDRLQDLYAQVAAQRPGLIAVVNSPGASLVGEDLTAIGGPIPTIRLDHAPYSGGCGEGFQNAVLAVLDSIPPTPVPVAQRHGINLVGLSILHLDWQDSLTDLQGLLGLCGISVRGIIGAGWSTEEIRHSAEATLNVVVHAEYGERLAKEYERRCGIPYVISPAGAPLGFDALETWLRTVCTAAGADPSPGLARIQEGRRQAARSVAVLAAYQLQPRGRTFSVEADGSTAYAAARFLYEYLGMIPVAAACPGGGPWETALRAYFAERHIPVGDDPQHTNADVMIASGSLGASARSRGVALGSVNVEAPDERLVHVTPAPVLGLGGTLRLLDGVLNVIADRQRFR